MIEHLNVICVLEILTLMTYNVFWFSLIIVSTKKCLIDYHITKHPHDCHYNGILIRDPIIFGHHSALSQW